MTRTVIVTGGTRGIGAAISKTFQKEGYKVIANYAYNDEVANKFNSETGIPVYKWDVSDAEECSNGVKSIINEHGNVEILVNNAGITRDATMHKMSVEKWTDVINTNLNSCFNMSRVVIDSMREKRFGRIVNISSINAQAGQFGQTNYSAAKAGVIGFTKALSLETASRGITVNAVAPGYIATDMTKNIKQEILDSLIAQIPVKRLGTPEEIADCVLFLASDRAGFITGETLSVNGGHHMD